MQHVKHLDSDITTHTEPQPAASIPALEHQEAAEIATVELQRFLDLLETLDGDDWQQPTACTLWNVKEIAAHQAGWEWGWSSFGNSLRLFKRDLIGPYRKKGMGMLDAINQAQVDLRADRTPAEIIAEIREMGPQAIVFRKRMPGILRVIPMPDLCGGMMTVGHLTDTILTRDMWMHRIDICRATGREPVHTPEHDGRIVALVVRELNRNLKSVVGKLSIVYDLRGISGGRWRIGQASTPAATITMDVIDFNLLASGRKGADDLLAEGRIRIEGDEAFAHKILQKTDVLY